MQFRRVRLARIEGHPDALRFRVGIDFLHSRDAQERLAQTADALVAIIAFGRDVDRLEHLVIGGIVQIMRVGRIHH